VAAARASKEPLAMEPILVNTTAVLRVLSSEMDVHQTQRKSPSSSCEHVKLFFRTLELECNVHNLPVDVAKHLYRHANEHNFRNLFHDASYPHVFCTRHARAGQSPLDFGKAIGSVAQEELYEIAHRYMLKPVDVLCHECAQRKKVVAGITLY
jgi:hypothetical protein